MWVTMALYSGPKSTHFGKGGKEGKMTTSKPRWEASQTTYLAGRSHLDGADYLAIEMERKWGAGRLRLLVTPEMRRRFDSQRLKLNQAVMAGDVGDLEREAGRMVKAWMALDAAAEAAGAIPLSPGTWDAPMADGRVLALVRTNEEALHVSRDGRHVEVWTLAEVVRVIEAFPEIAQAKQVWPGARVEAVRTEIRDPIEGWEALGADDVIPF